MEERGIVRVGRGKIERREGKGLVPATVQKSCHTIFRVWHDFCYGTIFATSETPLPKLLYQNSPFLLGNGKRHIE